MSSAGRPLATRVILSISALQHQADCGYRVIRAIETRLPPGGLNEISLMLLFFTRTMIVPSSRTEK